MGALATDLRRMGFERLEKESPIDERGTLWTDGHEVVCDQTGTVIDGDHHTNPSQDSDENIEWRCGEMVFRYQNSNRVKLPGGYVGSYDWGHDGSRFRY